MRRLVPLTGLLLAALLALAGPAAAHVTVTAPGASPGGSDQQITFRVPVEKNVDTVGLTVALPLSTPLVGVLVAPLPGWTHAEKTATLAKPVQTDDGAITSAVSEITWTATAGNGLKPGEFGSFTIIAGQLPDTGSLTFKAIQTYRDGSQSRWIETAAPGSSVQPENPAPVLKLSASSVSSASAAPAGAAKSGSGSNTGPIVLSIVALLVAAAALGLAVVDRVRRRS